MWFIAQLCFNYSLATTTVTSNTILSSSSSLFTYVLSCALMLEAFTAFKLAAILICITGMPAYVCSALLSNMEVTKLRNWQTSGMWPVSIIC